MLSFTLITEHKARNPCEHREGSSCPGTLHPSLDPHLSQLNPYSSLVDLYNTPPLLHYQPIHNPLSGDAISCLWDTCGTSDMANSDCHVSTSTFPVSYPDSSPSLLPPSSFWIPCLWNILPPNIL